MAIVLALRRWPPASDRNLPARRSRSWLRRCHRPCALRRRVVVLVELSDFMTSPDSATRREMSTNSCSTALQPVFALEKVRDRLREDHRPGARRRFSAELSNSASQHGYFGRQSPLGLRRSIAPFIPKRRVYGRAEPTSRDPPQPAEQARQLLVTSSLDSKPSPCSLISMFRSDLKPKAYDAISESWREFPGL